MKAKKMVFRFDDILNVFFDIVCCVDIQASETLGKNDSADEAKGKKKKKKKKRVGAICIQVCMISCMCWCIIIVACLGNSSIL